MFTIQDARKWFMQETNALLETEEQAEIFARCMDHLTQEDRLKWKLNASKIIDQEKLKTITDALKQGKPIQYCLGYEWFGELKLMVNEHVLIPRPETYELALWVKDVLQQHKDYKRIIDLGTGSGCIPIWLQHQFPQLHVSAMDVSPDALQVARENAKRYACDIDFIEDDLLNSTYTTTEKFDVIISNPPYITLEEKAEMLPNVLEHEPQLALFVTDGDALQFYKAIGKFAMKHLQDAGELFVEINQAYAHEVKALFESLGFATSLRNDMYENARMVHAVRRQ